jgi:citrate lyase alpha subunit
MGHTVVININVLGDFVDCAPGDSRLSQQYLKLMRAKRCVAVIFTSAISYGGFSF